MPLPYEFDRNPARPDICIGTDEFHTPSALKDLLASQFNGMGYSIAVNRPFSGALVPSHFYRKDNRVKSVMIEVNRTLYMDESTGVKSNSFYEVRDVLSKVLSTLRKRGGNWRLTTRSLFEGRNGLSNAPASMWFVISQS